MKLIPACLLIVSSVGLAACTNAGEDTSAEEHIGSAALAGNSDSGSGNGLNSYSLRQAAIFQPSVVNGLINNPLIVAQMDPVVKQRICGDTGGMSDEAFRYLVKCALPSTQSVGQIDCGNGITKGPYAGRYGLADGAAADLPWGNANGSCNHPYCQEWVSSCLMALSNALDHSGVQVDFAGTHATFTSPTPPSGYTKVEGAYFGNVFNFTNSPSDYYGCRGRDADTQDGMNKPLMRRTCGGYDSTTDTSCTACTSDGTYSTCNKGPFFDNLTGATPPGVRSCAFLCGTDISATSTFYNNCTPDGSGTVYTRVITVWRNPTLTY